MIYKHVIKVVLLSETESLEECLGDDWNLDDVEYAITQGDCIGQTIHESTDIIPSRAVEDELIAMGNDGTFFDSFDEDSEEEQRRDEKNGLYGQQVDPCN